MENNKYLQELCNTLIDFAKQCHKKSIATQINEDYYKGKRDGFELAAKWLEEAMINIKYEDLYK